MELTHEVWRPVKGFEDFYDISSHGRIKSKRKNRILKPSKTGRYDHVSLRGNGKRKEACIHRLVAETFVSNPNGFPQINHKDENTRNNMAANLEWCTAKYNNAYGNHPKAAYTKVNQYSYDGEFIKQWDSINEAADYYGIKYQGISRCCRGLRKHCYGFVWRYAGRIRRWQKRTAS